MELIPIILSGGAGSRLWPVSRELHPKPFMLMEDGETLLQKTLSRAVNLSNVVEIITVTNRDLYFKTQDDYSLVNTGDLPCSFILEPFGRNTAPAIAIAALKIAKSHGDDALMLVLAADHLIVDQDAFSEAVSNATQLAQQAYLVTFGIRPETPETGFGYIAADSHSDLLAGTNSQGYVVKQFVEKPSLDKAKEYLASGNYFWNSGMFCFSVGTLLAELEQYAPEVLNSAKASFASSYSKSNENTGSIRLTEDDFSHAPDISIDFALMEKSNKVAMIACDIGWSDIGSWYAISELKQPDSDGNRVVGQALLHDVTNCYIQNEGRMVGAIGIDNLIIVDTADALLIADKTRSQDVKKIVTQLKQGEYNLHKTHLEVHRPWGTYTVLEEGENFQIKRIVVKPAAYLSLQTHHHRSEHWVVVSGIAQVTNDGKEFLLNKNESTYISAGHKHRLGNPGVVDLIIIEVQSGEYLGEDDIVRFDDMYGRE
ncbi:MAG: mannose-1-phosphate guanylyltransferase/mannose-6-phosphate isomerase [Piscirickettsiaceae bacterium]|nr:mannose-1-phosphate guanylyltransferase/mannose-6-phosphate isomerase [Piscirickettsiaceae bacterium]